MHRVPWDLISGKLLALTEGVLKTMLLTRLKLATTVLFLMVLVGWGIGALTDTASAVGHSDPARGPVTPDKIAVALAPEAPRRAGPPRVVGAYNSPLLSVAWSADGRWLAAGTQDGFVHLTEIAGDRESRSFDTNAAVQAIAFAPDGKTLAVSKAGQPMSLWDVGGFRRPLGIAAGNISATHVAFMPDSKTAVGVAVALFVELSPNGAWVMSMDNPAGGGCAAVAPDGTASGWCDARGLLRVQSGQGQARLGERMLGTLQVGPTECIAFGPGGKLLAVGGGDDKAVQLWDLRAKQKTTLLKGLEKPAACLSFSADGHSLSALAADGITIVIWDLSRNSVRCRISHNRGAGGLQVLSPDGKFLAAPDKEGTTLLLWNLAARQLLPQASPFRLSSEELATLWADFAGPDAGKADAAWHKLGGARDNAIPFIRQQVRPLAVPNVDTKSLEKLAAELDSESFAIREGATKELVTAGEAAIVPLQRLLDRKPSLEAEKRARIVLQKISKPVVTRERLRVLEAIDLLEQVRTADAIALLQEIERDTLIPQIRREAQQVLQRVAQR